MVSRIDPKKASIGTLAYTVGTFALAILWHIVLFKPHYYTFGYFDGEPSFLTGLASIVIQGFVLSILFPLVGLSGTSFVRGLKFAFLIGAFFWTSHVLAFIAKQTIDNPGLFIAMETVYLGLQFGLFGLLIGLIYKDDNAT